MNYTEVGLDLQGLVKRIYASLLYNSTFYNFLNEDYIGEVRKSGTPMIEVMKSKDVTVNVRETKEISKALNPALAGYDSVKVDLTELPMDYSIRIPVLVMGSGVENAISDALSQKDSAVAKQVDTYGFNMLETAITGEGDATANGSKYTWTTDYIANLNAMKAILFNLNVTGAYRLGIKATEYAKIVASLTSVLKFETLTGVEGVDRGEIAKAYGVDIFEINDNYIKGTNTVGFFASPVGVVGDAFFDSMVEYNGNYPGFPGYYVLEGNILFGAKVVRPEAVIKVVTAAA